MPDFTTGGKGLSDYTIARKIDTDPPSVTRSSKNAHEKLEEAKRNLEWAERTGAKNKGPAGNVSRDRGKLGIRIYLLNKQSRLRNRHV
jgi:hypothetical protein